MSENRIRWVVRAVWVVTAIFAVTNATLLVVGLRADQAFNAMGVVAGLIYAWLGLLIAVRARNLIGWILVGTAFAIDLLTFSSVYPVVGLVSHPGSLPAPKVVAAVGQPMFVLAFVSLAVILLLFPDGAPPSRRWRPVLWVLVAGMVAGYVGDVLNPVPINPVGNLRFANPVGIESLATVISTALVGVGYVTVLASIAGFVGLVRRYRRGDRELREQVKWLALAAAGAGGCMVIALASLFACHCDQSPVAGAMFILLTAIVAFGVPGAIAVAILKYRLYDIDVIISKAVLYTILAAALTAIYSAIVIGIGTAVGNRGNSFLTAVAAVVIALGFQPLRERARRLANRLVYGKRATPYEVLTEFSDRVAGTYSDEDVLPRMAQILQSGTGAATARVWLRLGGELTPAASWPGNGAAAPIPVAGDRAAGFPAGEHGVEVRHQGEMLGALSVSMPPSDPMDPTKAKLVSDLAAQAGLVLRNVRLIEELRASRRRIVTAQDARAKALERNIHDGAQQQLVAMAVKLRLAEQLTERDAARAREMLASLQGEMTDALENLRDLARGIYPPLLADRGLVAALVAQARKGAVPTTVEAEAVGRYPPEVEAAVYFCCLEALQNVAKYAGASRACIRLGTADGDLRFSVEDDGRGFDTANTGYGTGMQGMADRLDAIGGTLHVRSEPGKGTAITGLIPARAFQAAPSV